MTDDSEGAELILLYLIAAMLVGIWEVIGFLIQVINISVAGLFGQNFNGLEFIAKTWLLRPSTMVELFTNHICQILVAVFFPVLAQLSIGQSMVNVCVFLAVLCYYILIAIPWIALLCIAIWIACEDEEEKAEEQEETPQRHPNEKFCSYCGAKFPGSEVNRLFEG